MTDDHSSVEAVALKACPFCGGAGIAREWENWLWCQDCEADGPYKNTQAEAVAAWNARATSTDQDKLVGELAEALQWAMAFLLPPSKHNTEDYREHHKRYAALLTRARQAGSAEQ